MVLRANEWMVEQGHESFCEVLEVSPSHYRVQLLSVDGVPQVPSLEAVVEFWVNLLLKVTAAVAADSTPLWHDPSFQLE